MQEAFKGLGSVALTVFLVFGASPVLEAQDRVETTVDAYGRFTFSYAASVPAADRSVVPDAAAEPKAAPKQAAVPAPGPTSVPAAVVPAPPARSRSLPSLAGMPVELWELVEPISTKHGVDPHLVAAVMKTESNFDPFARSPKGARGLMQLIPETGRRFGVRDFYSPAQNIEGGVRFLRFLLDKFAGNLDLTLAAYNAGENLVERLGRVPPIRETREYVSKVQKLYIKGAKSPTAAVAAKGPVTAPVISELTALPAAEPDGPKIYRTVDERGVIHLSNTGPLN